VFFEEVVNGGENIIDCLDWFWIGYDDDVDDQYYHDVTVEEVTVVYSLGGCGCGCGGYFFLDT
jgi:hypothetical protein